MVRAAWSLDAPCGLFILTQVRPGRGSQEYASTGVFSGRMTEIIVHARWSRPEVLAFLRSLPAVLAGNAPDAHGLAAGFKARLAFTWIGLVKEAFEVKGRGGTGSDGITWAPLKPATIKAKATKGMTASQKSKWSEDYRAAFRGAAGQMSEPEARQKAETAATRAHEKRVGRQVESGSYQILVDTGVLRQSLTVGTLNEGRADAHYSPPNQDQFYDNSKPGEVSIGTTTDYAKYHHHGTKHIPARPFWPEQLPQAWEEELLRQAQLGIQRIVEIVS